MPDTTIESTTIGSAVTEPFAAQTYGVRRWVVAFVLCLSVLTGFFDRISVAVLFTNTDFTSAIGIGFDPVKLGWLMTAFLLAYGASSLLLGGLGDLLGPRLTLAVSAGIWGLTMIVMGSTSSYLVMIICRVVLGLAEGPQFALLSKTVTRWFPPAEHGRANSTWMIGGPLGSALGFPLSIWLVHEYGWRASFHVLAALNLLIVIPLVLLVVSDWPPGTTAQQKHALESSNSRGATMAEDFRHLAGNLQFWLLVVLNCGVLIYLWGLTSWLPTYLEKVHGLRLAQLGIFSSLPFLLTFLAEIATGFVSDWLGRRAIIALLGLLCAGALMYVGSQMSDPYLAATLIALSSAGWGFAVPCIYAMSYAVIPKRLTATGVGAVNGVGNLLGAVTPLIMGIILAQTGSYNAGLMVIVLGSIFFACAALPLLRRY